VVENVNKGYIGILFEDASSLKIGSVSKGGAAEKAKIKAGDEIIALGSVQLKNRTELMELLDGKKPGEKVVVKVRRKVPDADDPEELEFTITLGGRPAGPGGADRGELQNSMGSNLSGRRTGFPRVIQTDAVVKPEDCGGPLVDLDGRVVGLTIARAGRVESWALAEEEVTPVFKDLKAGKFPPPKTAKTSATKDEPKKEEPRKDPPKKSDPPRSEKKDQ
jgi:serine protease Do